jgi:hypothetical protein
LRETRVDEQHRHLEAPAAGGEAARLRHRRDVVAYIKATVTGSKKTVTPDEVK